MDDPAALLAVLYKRDATSEKAVRSLRKLAQANSERLNPYSAELLKLAMAEQDLRIRWNLIVILGNLTLKAANRSLAVDWLFERLMDASPLTRTFALQALFDLSRRDDLLRERWRPIALEFAKNGTAAMRARARKLLQTTGA